MWTIVPFIVNCCTWTILKGVSTHGINYGRWFSLISYCLFHETTFDWSSFAFERQCLFMNELKSVFLNTKSNHVKLGMRIFLKIKTTHCHQWCVPHQHTSCWEGEASRCAVGEMKETNCLCPKGCLQVSIQSAFILRNKTPLGPLAALDLQVY